MQIAREEITFHKLSLFLVAMRSVSEVLKLECTFTLSLNLLNPISIRLEHLLFSDNSVLPLIQHIALHRSAEIFLAHRHGRIGHATWFVFQAGSVQTLDVDDKHFQEDVNAVVKLQRQHHVEFQ